MKEIFRSWNIEVILKEVNLVMKEPNDGGTGKQLIYATQFDKYVTTSCRNFSNKGDAIDAAIKHLHAMREEIGNE